MLMSFRGTSPRVGRRVFIAPSAQLIGDVEIGDCSSVWHNAVIRGDRAGIRIGRYSNVQDGAVLHVSKGFPVEVGDFVSIAHGCAVHGCSIGDNSLIGMGAVVLNGVSIGENCLVGAGAVLPEGRSYPPNSLILGVPAKVVRELSREEVLGIRKNAEVYHSLAMEYMGEEP
ncbi:gamma carbonic anhydrase family protein [Candidatus Pyrohabitans sp.]